MKLFLRQLIFITGRKDFTDSFINELNDCLEKYEINNSLRICHFLAQVCHESLNFHYTEELASGAAYEGRSDLGNIYKGDGTRFKGRGYLMITGRENYRKLSQDLDFNFVNKPDWLEKECYAISSAGWFWNKKGLNKFADNDWLKLITKRINGGYNGLADRRRILLKCKEIL